MSDGSRQGVEVLRGIQLDTVPLRLGRRLGAPGASTGPVRDPECLRAEEAVRAGFAEGLKHGRAEGLQSGYEEGLRKGGIEAELQARAHFDAAVQQALGPLREQQIRLAALASSLQPAMQECLAAAEDELAALCLETLGRALGSVLRDPVLVRGHLAHLLSLARAGSLVDLHVHPDDVALLEEACLAAALATPGTEPAIRWVADPEVVLGGCVVHACGGGIDARLETLLEKCKQAMVEARAKRRRGNGEQE